VREGETRSLCPFLGGEDGVEGGEIAFTAIQADGPYMDTAFV
jgi:hypothetical protein